jgi:hypothetical protein
MSDSDIPLADVSTHPAPAEETITPGFHAIDIQEVSEEAVKDTSPTTSRNPNPRLAIENRPRSPYSSISIDKPLSLSDRQSMSSQNNPHPKDDDPDLVGERVECSETSQRRSISLRSQSSFQERSNRGPTGSHDMGDLLQTLQLLAGAGGDGETNKGGRSRRRKGKQRVNNNTRSNRRMSSSLGM